MGRGELGTRVLGQECWDRTARTGQLGKDTWREQLGKDNCMWQERDDRLARRCRTGQLGLGQPVAGLPRQYSWNKTSGMGQSRHLSRERSAWQISLDLLAWTGQSGQDGQKMAGEGQDIWSRTTGTGQPEQDNQLDRIEQLGKWHYSLSTLSA